MTEFHKEHIGDGVYASTDGYHIWLRTERGDGRLHEIALEAPVFAKLVAYETKLRALVADARVTEEKAGG